MALQEKHRTRLYAHLVEHVGEETAEAMLSQFPTRDLDEPVTKEFVALTAAQLRTEFEVLRTELEVLRTEMSDLELRLKDEIHQQSGRIMNRMQLVFGIGFAALAVSNALVG